MALVYLVELAVVSPAGVASTLYLSYPAVRPFPPGDPDRPNQVYEPRLIEPANVEISLYGDMSAGVGDIGGGALVIANGDGRYSYLRGYAVRSVDIRAGTDGQAWAQFSPVFAGSGGVPEVDVSTRNPSRVTIAVSDARAVLEAAIDTGTYAGTNAGAAGYEGTADDLKGRPKPLALGDLSTANVPAVPVNVAGRVFQLNAGAIQSVGTLYDRGGAAGLTLLGDYAGAAFDAAAPSSTQYATDRARGLLKLGGTLGGELTVDFLGSNAGGYADTAPPLIRRLLERRGVPAGKIGGSFAAVTAPAKVGLWTGAEAPPARELVDTLCRSMLGWCVPDALGVWQLGRLEAPIGTPALTLGADELLELEADRFGVGVPAAEVRVLWGRNYRRMSKNEVAGAVATSQPARLAFLESEYRTAKWTSADNLARYGLAAPTLEIETALRLEVDAVALAAAWGALFGVPRQAYRVTVALTAEVRALGLGGLVSLSYPPLGISGLFRLVGWRPTAPKIHLATLRLWG